MLPLDGPVQRYAWGDQEAIPRLFGREPDGTPQAEWWLGTHPNGPSTVEVDGELRPLASLSGPLPFLAKVLAAAEPLSLQAHPDAAAAAAGCAREDAAGIERGSPARHYQDPFGKPEVLCALTPFEALCGFRDLDETVSLLRDLRCPATVLLADRLEGEGLAETFSYLLVDRPPLVGDVVVACRAHRGPHEAITAWVDRLARHYPNDPALPAVLLLNHVVLQPGEALYLPSGTVHAYLHGAGVEVMGCSDNVLRAGLTQKHVDPTELVRIVSTEVLTEPRAVPHEHVAGQVVYETPGAPFRLTRIELAGTLALHATGPEVLIATAGDAGPLRAGEARYVQSGECYVLRGEAQVFRVEVVPVG